MPRHDEILIEPPGYVSTESIDIHVLVVVR
jgi:hypothetical protein